MDCLLRRTAQRGVSVFFADQEGPASASASPSAPDNDGDVEMVPVPVPAPPSLPSGRGAENAVQADDGVAEGDAEEESGEEGEGPALFSLVSDSTWFDGILNLDALRLFDVSVRVAPAPLPTQPPTSLGSTHHRQQKQHQQHQHQHQHRLTCKRGLQETYETCGHTLWIYDAHSCIDNCT
jgi:hypothetical protein